MEPSKSQVYALYAFGLICRKVFHARLRVGSLWQNASNASNASPGPSRGFQCGRGGSTAYVYRVGKCPSPLSYLSQGERLLGHPSQVLTAPRRVAGWRRRRVTSAVEKRDVEVPWVPAREET